MAEHPRVFISYSHDSEEHREAVLCLVEDLRRNGVDAWFDRAEQAPAEGWLRWMESQISTADFVLVICTETYRERAEGRNPPGRGLGANYEGRIINQTIYDENGRNAKFLPILLEEAGYNDVPVFLREYQRYTYPGDREGLLRRLTDQPEIVLPEVGQAPALPPRRRISSPSPRSSQAGGGNAASKLVENAGCQIPEPWRQAIVSPYTAPQPVFRRAAFRKVATESLLSADASHRLSNLPSLACHTAKAMAEGLVWCLGEDLPYFSLAIGFDGSVAMRQRLWEADHKSLQWGPDGVAVGSTVDLIVAVISIADRLLPHAAERRPSMLSMTLSGIQGRHLAYDGEERHYGSMLRSDLPTFTQTEALPVNPSRDKIVKIVESIAAQLEYPFGTVDLKYVRRRISASLSVALPRLSHRFHKDELIVEVGNVELVSGGSTHADGLHPVRVQRDGTTIGEGLFDIETSEWVGDPGIDESDLVAALRQALSG